MNGINNPDHESCAKYFLMLMVEAADKPRVAESNQLFQNSRRKKECVCVVDRASVTNHA
jgi:hypothetical protein